MFLFCRSLIAFIGSALVAVQLTVARVVAFAIETIAEPFELSPGTPRFAVNAGGAPTAISADLYQRNRHEAGVSRRSAERNV
jgi:hypothetical protein